MGTKLALAQLSPMLGDKEKNMDMMEKTVDGTEADMWCSVSYF